MYLFYNVFVCILQTYLIVKTPKKSANCDIKDKKNKSKRKLFVVYVIYDKKTLRDLSTDQKTTD